MRLVLSFKGVEWTDRADSLADSSDARGAMKTNGGGLFPFRQSPTYEDPEALPPLSATVAALPQSNAILRHLARQHALYGDGSLRQAADVDVLLEAVESLRLPYVGLIYRDQLAEAAKASYVSTHLDRATADLSRNGGAHFAYLEQYLEASSGGKEAGGWAVGKQATVADFAVYEVVDLHLRIFPEQIKKDYALLAAHHAMVAALPGVKEYLSSPRCLAQVNNNNLG